MTLQLELKPQTERELRQAAQARDMQVEQYVLSIVESSLRSSVIPANNPSKTPEEFKQNLKNLAQFSGQMPHHSGQTWSREVIYDESLPEEIGDFKEYLQSLALFAGKTPNCPADFWTREIVSAGDDE